MGVWGGWSQGGRWRMEYDEALDDGSDGEHDLHGLEGDEEASLDFHTLFP